MDKTLLILSADEVLKRKYTKVLLQNGFKVADAADLIDGMLLANKHNIDAIIVDEDLEDKNIQLNYSKIRKYSQAPLIFLVAEPPDEIPHKSEGNGYNTYFEKSEDPTELVAYVQIIVSQIELKGKPKTLVPESPAKVETSTQADPVFSLITNLEKQVARMKAFMNTLHQIQQTISESEIIIRERQRELDTVVNKLNEVKRQITDITGSSDTDL